MDKIVPLDFWLHGKDKMDGYEVLLTRRDNEIFLGVFSWSDEAKEYNLPAFGKGGVQTLEGRHSVVIPYTGKLSFDDLCKAITQSL